MSDWTKIMSFDNMYDAEIRRQLLQNAEIKTVVINARDSLLLVGNVDLYVNANEEKKALTILQQFQGLTKVNSFILKKPIVLFQKILEENGFETTLKEREDDKYILENYELYVKNDQAQQIAPFLTGEKLEGWTKIDVCERVLQTRYKIEILAEKGIEALIIKKKDSDFHTEDVSIFVKNENEQKAKDILTQLKGWAKIKTFKKIEIAELRVDVLSKHGIRGLIVKNNEQFDLFVKANKEEEALDVMKSTKEWVEVRRYGTALEAEAMLPILHENDIEASVLTIRDSMFLIGGYAMYVEKRMLTEAIELLTETEGGKIIE